VPSHLGWHYGVDDEHVHFDGCRNHPNDTVLPAWAVRNEPSEIAPRHRGRPPLQRESCSRADLVARTEDPAMEFDRARSMAPWEERSRESFQSLFECAPCPCQKENLVTLDCCSRRDFDVDWCSRRDYGADWQCSHVDCAVDYQEALCLEGAAENQEMIENYHPRTPIRSLLMSSTPS